ncbi:THUMP-like domain-containing protein [Corynebacterium sp. 335C]
MSLTREEVRALAARPELLAAADGLALTRKTMLADLGVLREAAGDPQLARAAAEVGAARRSAAGKLPEAFLSGEGAWLLDSDAAQQATPWAVAELRARRIAELAPGRVVHDVTCAAGTEIAAMAMVAGGGTADAGEPAAGDAAPAVPAAAAPADAAPAPAALLATDLDPARAEMARRNLAGAAPGALVAVADALAPVSRDAVVVADPARRAGGRRIARPEDLVPPLPDLLDAYAGRELSVKCAPGLDFSGWEGEVCVASVAGGVKEACLYTPGLSRPGVTRSAALLGGARSAPEFVDDAMDDDCGAGDAGAYIIDPDGAVVRAGLVRHWARRHGLRQLDERIAHLTGDAVPPGASGFPVLEEVPLKKVRAALAARDCGSAEILVRGLDADPDRLRKSWRLKGRAALAVVVTRIGDRGTAFICGPRETVPA